MKIPSALKITKIKDCDTFPLLTLEIPVTNILCWTFGSAQAEVYYLTNFDDFSSKKILIFGLNVN